MVLTVDFSSCRLIQLYTTLKLSVDLQVSCERLLKSQAGRGDARPICRSATLIPLAAAAAAAGAGVRFDLSSLFSWKARNNKKQMWNGERKKESQKERKQERKKERKRDPTSEMLQKITTRPLFGFKCREMITDDIFRGRGRLTGVKQPETG